MRASQNDLIYFLNLDSCKGICILVFQKRRFCGQELAKGKLQTWSDTKTKTFDGFFCRPLGIKPHSFVKNSPIFRNIGLFYVKF